MLLRTNNHWAFAANYYFKVCKVSIFQLTSVEHAKCMRKFEVRRDQKAIQYIQYIYTYLKAYYYSYTKACYFIYKYILYVYFVRKSLSYTFCYPIFWAVILPRQSWLVHTRNLKKSQQNLSRSQFLKKLLSKGLIKFI